MQDTPATEASLTNKPKKGYTMSLKSLRKNLNRVRRIILARHLRLARVAFFGVIILLAFGLFTLVFGVLRNTKVGEYAGMANKFLFQPAGTVKDINGRTNILLLGIAGDGVKNPKLSDTIIFASFRHNPPKVDLISIPRDIWVPELNDKINSAYFYGNENGKGGGLLLAKNVVEEVVGQPIHYAIALNFDGFTEIIDILGGVDVEVERSFTDEHFPIPGKEDNICDGDPEYSCRYETVSFEKGTQHMDGETALKFSRSRHSIDPLEGNDLARASRQQKVILAIKDKLLDGHLLLSPRKSLRLWSSFWKIVETDLTKPQMAYIARLAYNSKDSVITHALPEELLFNPPYSEMYDFLFVFIPNGEDWSKVHDWVTGALNED